MTQRSLSDLNVHRTPENLSPGSRGRREAARGVLVEFHAIQAPKALST
jgi:hypothetical protein